MKKNPGRQTLERVRELIKEELTLYKSKMNPNPRTTEIFTWNNNGSLCLQFCGWCITLDESGHWAWEDTTGG